MDLKRLQCVLGGTLTESKEQESKTCLARADSSRSHKHVWRFSAVTPVLYLSFFSLARSSVYSLLRSPATAAAVRARRGESNRERENYDFHVLLNISVPHSLFHSDSFYSQHFKVLREHNTKKRRVHINNCVVCIIIHACNTMLHIWHTRNETQAIQLIWSNRRLWRVWKTQSNQHESMQLTVHLTQSSAKSVSHVGVKTMILSTEESEFLYFTRNWWFSSSCVIRLICRWLHTHILSLSPSVDVFLWTSKLKVRITNSNWIKTELKCSKHRISTTLIHILCNVSGTCVSCIMTMTTAAASTQHVFPFTLNRSLLFAQTNRTLHKCEQKLEQRMCVCVHLRWSVFLAAKMKKRKHQQTKCCSPFVLSARYHAVCSGADRFQEFRFFSPLNDDGTFIQRKHTW